MIMASSVLWAVVVASSPAAHHLLRLGARVDHVHNGRALRIPRTPRAFRALRALRAARLAVARVRHELAEASVVERPVRHTARSAVVSTVNA